MTRSKDASPSTPSSFSSHRALAVCALLAAPALLWRFVENQRAAATSYLFALALLASLTLGATLSLLVGHATDAKWFIAVRRPLEVVASSTPILFVLALPIALSIKAIYPWAAPDVQPPDVAEVLRQRGAWCEPSLMFARGAGLLLAVVAISEFITRQGQRAGAEARRRLVRFSAALLPVFGLLTTFLAFDGLMSLEPRYYSTIYGAYVLAGAFSSATALHCVLLAFFRHRERMQELKGSHFHAVGRVLLASVCVWAYFAYSQFYLGWIADVPAEARFLLRRASSRWKGVALAYVLAQFGIPFVALLSRRLKYSVRALSAVASVILLGHALDIYSLVVPGLQASAIPDWSIVPALLFVFSTATWFGSWRGRRTSLLPTGDPQLADSLVYESP